MNYDIELYVKRIMLTMLSFIMVIMVLNLQFSLIQTRLKLNLASVRC